MYVLLKMIVVLLYCVSFILHTYVTLSVKTQLKSFFVDLLFSTKNHPSYGKEHSMKM